MVVVKAAGVVQSTLLGYNTNIFKSTNTRVCHSFFLIPVTGEYFRTNPKEHPVKRIEQTMDEVGVSITMTSVTTMFAFALGSFSSIPGVRWLCSYAFAAIAADYFFQITYFVALLVLDERRVQAHQQNCCFWRPVPRDEDSLEDDEDNIMDSDDYNDEHDDSSSEGSVIMTDSMMADEEDDDVPPTSRRRKTRRRHRPRYRRGRRNKPAVPEEHFSERFMIWYSKQLLRPISKALVLFAFSCYFGFCLYRATLLTRKYYCILLFS